MSPPSQHALGHLFCSTNASKKNLTIYLHIATQQSTSARMVSAARHARPTLTKKDGDDEEIKLISSRKQRSEAMKTESVKADKRTMVLFKSIRDQNWEDVLKHLDYYERDAKQWIEEVNDDGSKRWRSLPIHLVS